MHSSYVIFSATREEIFPLIQNQQEIQTGIYRIQEQGYVLITGIGPYAAHRGALKALSLFRSNSTPSWLNIGLSGTLSQTDSDIGSWSIPKYVSLLSWHPRSGFTKESTIEIADGNPAHCLYTAPLPIYDTRHVAADGGYIDMEAYPILEVASQHQIHCDIFKIVSDRCSSSSREEIRSRIHFLSDAIAEKSHLWLITKCELA